MTIYGPFGLTTIRIPLPSAPSSGSAINPGSPVREIRAGSDIPIGPKPPRGVKPADAGVRQGEEDRRALTQRRRDLGRSAVPRYGIITRGEDVCVAPSSQQLILSALSSWIAYLADFRRFSLVHRQTKGINSIEFQFKP